MTALLWLGVFPLWQRGSYTHITGDKWLGMLVITALSVFFRCDDLIGKKKRGERLLPVDERDVKKHIPQILCALYFLCVALSALFGAANSQRNESGQLAVLIGAVRYEGLLTQLCYFLIFLCMSAEHYSSRRCEKAAAAAMLIYLAVVIAQYAGADPFGLYPAGLSIRTNPAFQGTIGNIDLVSGYAVLVTGFLFALFLSEQKGGWLAFAGGTAGVALSACMGVQSGLLALAAGVFFALYHMAGHPEIRFRAWLVLSATSLCAFVRSLILFPWADGTPVFAPAPFGRKQLAFLLISLLALSMEFLRDRHPGHAVNRRLRASITASILLVLVLSLVFIPFTEDDGALWEAHQILRGEGEDHFGSWRLGVWRLTVKLSSAHLLFGTGPDTFWYVFNPAWAEYEAQLHENGLTQNTGEWLERFDNPHNEFLAILSNNGLPALLVYLAFLFALFRCAFTSGEECTLRKAAAVGVLLFIIQGLFSFSNCLVSPVFWALAGMAANTKI